MKTGKVEKPNFCSGCTITYSESKEYDCEGVCEFLLNHRVITNSVDCPHCGHLAKLSTSKKALICGGFITKNKRKRTPCNYRKSVWSQTLFHRSKVPQSTVFRLVGAVLLLPPPKNAAVRQDVAIKDSQLVNWFLSIREVLIDAVSINSKKLGGENLVVELAEAKWKSDNLKGGLWDWAFGGIEHHSRETFLVPVQHHNLKALKKIISQKINPGTTIVTDCINCFTTEDVMDLKKSLNVNFVLPADSTISGVIKHHWAEVRKGLINLASKRPPSSIYQLAEYLFKSKYPVPGERIHSFFVAAGLLYPPDKCGWENQQVDNILLDFN